MITFPLSFFKKSKTDALCADDFNRVEQTEAIGLEYVVSLSILMMFEKPLTGTPVAKYAVVTMNSGDYYFIKEESYKILNKVFQPSIGIRTRFAEDEVVQEMKRLYIKEFGSLKYDNDRCYFMVGFVQSVFEELYKKSKHEL